MRISVLFAASSFLLTLRGAKAAPWTLHSDPDSYRSTIDHLVAVQNQTKLCLIRQELDFKEKTQVEVDLLNYLDRRALELHGLKNCSTVLDYSATIKPSPGTESGPEEQESTFDVKPVASHLPDEPANAPDPYKLSKDGEPRCQEFCHQEAPANQRSSTVKECDDDYDDWQFKLGLIISLVLGPFVLLLCLICCFIYRFG